MLKRLARTCPNVAFLNFIEVQEELRSGELRFVPLAGRNARQKIVLVHRASGHLDPVASVVAHFVSDAAQAKAAAFLSSYGPVTGTA
jgi:DNA-binding transcriptional LysR family regulator